MGRFCKVAGVLPVMGGKAQVLPPSSDHGKGIAGSASAQLNLPKMLNRTLIRLLLFWDVDVGSGRPGTD